MKRKPIIAAIHGILTGETSREWHSRFKDWLWQRNEGVWVVNREYLGGPIPWWTVAVRNPAHAGALAEFLAPYAKAGAEISFVAHSNGANIAVAAIRSLTRETGCRVDSLIVIGAAIHSDIERNGISDLIDDDSLGKAVAFWSPADRALALKVKWPFGELGRRGFTFAGRPYESDRIISRQFPGYDHSSYFAGKHEADTFARIVAELGAGFTFVDAAKAAAPPAIVAGIGDPGPASPKPATTPA